MYSIIKKNGTIVNFLAEKDEDILHIKDVCTPGSTVEVLKSDDEENKDKHTFIKSPSGKWHIYEGESDFEFPVNDAKVSVPNSKSMAPTIGETRKVEEFQRGVKIYQSGLVTGTLLNTTSDMYTGEESKGHYLIIDLETPEGATSYDLSIGKDETKKTQVPCDGWLMLRLENVLKDNNKPIVEIKYDTDGPSFTFILDELVLE